MYAKRESDGRNARDEVSENRPSEHSFSFLEQYDSDIFNLTLHSKHNVELQDLDLGLLLLLSLLHNVARLASEYKLVVSFFF